MEVSLAQGAAGRAGAGRLCGPGASLLRSATQVLLLGAGGQSLRNVEGAEQGSCSHSLQLC